jgi:hypothetical protein
MEPELSASPSRDATRYGGSPRIEKKKLPGTVQEWSKQLSLLWTESQAKERMRNGRQMGRSGGVGGERGLGASRCPLEEESRIAAAPCPCITQPIGGHALHTWHAKSV